MPGYYIHLATINPLTRRNKSFVYGVEMPDILKNYLRNYGLTGAKAKYNSLKTKVMPDFSYFELRVQEKEINGQNFGLHYGVSSNPNINNFWYNLTSEQKQNPFFKGYLWHLLTDLLMYKYLEIERKTAYFISQNKDVKNLEELKKQEKDKLHADWDKTNAKILKDYPDVTIPLEISELKIIKFINDNQINYVDWEIVKSLIDYLRLFNPLKEDIDIIIEKIINLLPNPNTLDIKDTLSRKLKKI